jgi:hypothetical protein
VNDKIDFKFVQHTCSPILIPDSFSECNGGLCIRNCTNARHPSGVMLQWAMFKNRISVRICKSRRRCMGVFRIIKLPDPTSFNCTRIRVENGSGFR